MFGGTDILTIWEILIPVAMLIYGFKLWQNPPAFGGNGGLTTKYSQKNKDTWREGNVYGGKVMIIDGIVVAVVSLIKYFAIPAEGISWLYFVFMAIDLVLIFSIVPIVNRHLKKKFGLEKE